MNVYRSLRWFFFFALAGSVFAAGDLPFLKSTPAPDGGQNYSLTIQMFLIMTAMTFIPAMVLMMTSFTRIVIVLSLLRQAMGTIQSPPNQIIIGMALFLTFFIMSPTLETIYDKAWTPMSEDKITFQQGMKEASIPLKDFMLRQTREEDLAFFIDLSREPKPETRADVSLKTLIPAFVVSEVKTAFQIGFMIFMPFLIIDLIVASILMAMGMMMVSPVIVALPFKLMLFVLVDGWTILMGSLVRSFY